MSSRTVRSIDGKVSYPKWPQIGHLGDAFTFNIARRSLCNIGPTDFESFDAPDEMIDDIFSASSSRIKDMIIKTSEVVHFSSDAQQIFYTVNALREAIMNYGVNDRKALEIAGCVAYILQKSIYNYDVQSYSKKNGIPASHPSKKPA